MPDDIPALRRDRLSWVAQNYFRDETITAANAMLVSEQNTIELAQKWGGGDVASADGMHFVVPVRTINAGPNPKYYGFSNGATWYNMMSDQIRGSRHPVPGTLRDSLMSVGRGAGAANRVAANANHHRHRCVF